MSSQLRNTSHSISDRRRYYGFFANHKFAELNYDLSSEFRVESCGVAFGDVILLM